MTTIRDLREQKNLSEDKVAAAAGLTYSRFVRIQEGSGKTTPEEITAVLTVLQGMEPGTRRLAGRPFKDADKRAAVAAAREAGLPVHSIITGDTARVPSPVLSTESAPLAAEEAVEPEKTKPKRVRSKSATPRVRNPK